MQKGTRECVIKKTAMNEKYRFLFQIPFERDWSIRWVAFEYNRIMFIR